MRIRVLSSGVRTPLVYCSRAMTDGCRRKECRKIYRRIDEQKAQLSELSMPTAEKNWLLLLTISTAVTTTVGQCVWRSVRQPVHMLCSRKAISTWRYIREKAYVGTSGGRRFTSKDTVVHKTWQYTFDGFAEWVIFVRSNLWYLVSWTKRRISHCE